MPHCELLPLFQQSPYYDGRRYNFPGHDSFRDALATQTHHICGSSGGAKRDNAATNTVRVCGPVHDWLERYGDPGFVLCVYHKCIRGELDAAKLEQILGGRPLRGQIDNEQCAQRCQEHPWVEAIRVRLLAAFDLGDRDE